MRYLNKIVFINSAHVRYAEINLNGNVHLKSSQDNTFSAKVVLPLYKDETDEA